MSLSGRKLLKIKILILLVVSTFCFAQEVEIKSVKPFLDNNKLAVKTEFTNLLNQDMIEGLGSGMARTLIFHFNLNSKNGEKINEFNRLVKLRYDVWENIYSLSNRKEKKQFKHFNSLNNFLNDSLNFILLSSNRISSEKLIQVVMYFSPENISETQKRKLDYWIDEDNDQNKKTNNDESESGFSINLSGLITLFTSKENPKNSTKGQSKLFTIKSLKTNENPSK